MGTRIDVIIREKISFHQIYSHGWCTRITTRNGVPIEQQIMHYPGHNGYEPVEMPEMPRGHKWIVSRHHNLLTQNALKALAML